MTEASRQADSARSEAVSAGQQRSAVLTEAFTRGIAKIRSVRSSSGSTSSSFEQLGETMNKLDQITRSVAGSTGLSQSQVARIALGASAHLGVNSGFAGAQVQASGDKAYMSGLSADEHKVLGSMSSEQIAEFKQFGDRVSRDFSFVNAVTNDSREARELGSRLATATSRSERAEANFSERSALSERLSSAREHGESISIDIAQDPHNLEMFMRYAEQYGGTSAAAAAMLDAELARQGLRPNRVSSDGSALPVSFEDLHRGYVRKVAEPVLNPDVVGEDHSHQRQITRFGNAAAVNSETATRPSVLRDEIQTKATEIRNKTKASEGGFDSKTEIIRTPDGVLASRKSLMKQSGKQVVDDAGASVDATKDAIKGLLNRK